MGNQIKVTACDNELLLIAYQWGKSYIVGHIQSGNNNTVDVNIDIVAGEYNQAPVLNGVNGPLEKSMDVALPAGDYTLVYAGINWGGPVEFTAEIFGKPYHLDDSKIGEKVGVVWALGNDSIQFTVA